jgi:hypothetical protein
MVVWEYISELHAGSGLGHQRGDCVSPGQIMFGLFVCRGSVCRAIGFDQNEASWVVLLLNYIESSNTRLGHAGFRVGQRRAFEQLHTIRFYAHLHMNHEHIVPLVELDRPRRTV